MKICLMYSHQGGNRLVFRVPSVDNVAIRRPRLYMLVSIFWRSHCIFLSSSGELLFYSMQDLYAWISSLSKVCVEGHHKRSRKPPRQGVTNEVWVHRVPAIWTKKKDRIDVLRALGLHSSYSKDEALVQDEVLYWKAEDVHDDRPAPDNFLILLC